jgi:N-6 DNA methylase
VEDGVISAMLSLPSNMFYSVTLPATLWFFDKARRDDKRVLFINARNTYRQVDRAHREFTDEHIANLVCIRHLYQGNEMQWHLLISHYEKRISELTQNYEDAVSEYNTINAEAEEFLTKNPGKSLKQDLKKRLAVSNTELEDAKAELDYMESMHKWLNDNFPEGKYRDVIGLCKAATIEEIREQDYSLNPGRYVGVSFDIEDKDDFKESMQVLREELLVLNGRSQELMESIMLHLNNSLGI